MNFFFQQYQYNLSIMLDNISKKINIPMNDLYNKYLTKKISNDIKIKIKNIQNIKNNRKKIIKHKNNLFEDKNGNIYYIINSHFKFGNIYDAIKLKK